MKNKSLLRGLLIAAITLTMAGGVFSQSVVNAQDIKPAAVAYGDVDTTLQTLDVYQPATGDKPLPAVILIHGGAGSFGDRSDLAEYAQGFAAAGYVAFNINYRLLSGSGKDVKNAWPAQLDDSQLAVRWIRANADKYNVDPDRICALGHSSGGQLAALLGERDTPKTGDLALTNYSSRVACVIDLAGTADLTIPFVDASIQPAITALMGGTAADVPDIYKDASPVVQVIKDTAPFLIFHGTNDEIVPVKQSRLMEDALHTAGVEVVYAEYPDATHFSWLGAWNLVRPEALAFLQRHLSPAS